MKKLSKGLILSALIAGIASPAMAEDGASWNVSLVSDYVWRGDSQTNNTATVQGGWDYEQGDVSVGVWASGVAAGSEFDLYGAYKLGPVSLGAIYYHYQLPAIGSYEINISGDAGPVELMASYAPDGGAYYLEGGYEHKLSDDMKLNLHVGYADDGAGATASDYSLGVGTAWKGADVALTYAAKEGGQGIVFMSIGKSM